MFLTKFSGTANFEIYHKGMQVFLSGIKYKAFGEGKFVHLSYNQSFMDRKTGVKKGRNPKKVTKATISKNVPCYAKDPFFIRKANESQSFLEEHGFPEELKSKNNI